MDLLSVIRRWHGRDKLPIREITRRTGLSRNTIKKYLANGEVTPAYPARKSVSKLDPFVDTLLSWLKREAKRNRKRRRNLKQLHRDLVALGFDGSYDRVAAFARDWRQRERERESRASRGAFCAARLCTRRGFPVRLERRLDSHWRQEDQAADGALQVVPQPSVLSSRLPDPDARDAVRRPQSCFPCVAGHSGARHLRQYEDRCGQGRSR